MAAAATVRAGRRARAGLALARTASYAAAAFCAVGRRARKGLALAVLAAGLLAATPTAASASADQQPPILAAYNLDWIERVRPEAWAPPAQRPIVCLLDTGVNVTPDTPPDHPDGPIVARLALDGGSGEAQGTTPHHLHGTQMASIIAAPRNDWGTVGIFPGARIVSVRATVGTDVHMSPHVLRHAVDACHLWARNHGASIAAVVMAESNYDQRPSDTAHWDRAAAEAERLGALFVAAVGNEDDAAVVAPISVRNVIPVAAGDPNGGLCGFSPPVGEGVLLGPGCDPHRGWLSGSSAATASVGALVAAIAARAPDLTAAERLASVAESTAPTSAGLRRVDGNALASRWFDGLLASTQPEVPIATPAVTVETPPTDGAKLLLWRPKVEARWRRGRLEVRRLTHRRTGRLVVEYSVRGRVKRVVTTAVRLRVRTPRRPVRVRAWVESRQPGRWRSMIRNAGVRRS